MTFTVIIPARYASQRLPGKPLVDIAGKTMIEHVYQRACLSSAKKVIVATDDQRIFDAVRAFDGEVCLTRDDHESGTDRLQEVVSLYGMDDDDIVVNVQGDEPLIPAAVIDQVAQNLRENQIASAATLSEPITDMKTVFDPNAVKVVKDCDGMAMYFSRASIPWERDRYPCSDENAQLHEVNAHTQRHIGIYSYRVALLNEFVTWNLAPLEQLEKLEQLRILSNGRKIHVEQACECVPGGVDTSEDLARVKNQLKNA